MDPRDYDRISDLLCQIRAKIENNLVTTKTKGHFTKHHYLMKVWELIEHTDVLADCDRKGLL
jgi:hypothetical protein